MQKYRLPQFYNKEERISLINKELSLGNTIYQVADMFGVGPRCIEYQLGIPPKKYRKPFEEHRKLYCA